MRLWQRHLALLLSQFITWDACGYKFVVHKPAPHLFLPVSAQLPVVRNLIPPSCLALVLTCITHFGTPEPIGDTKRCIALFASFLAQLIPLGRTLRAASNALQSGRTEEVTGLEL